MKVIKRISLDFSRSTSPVVVFAKQGDKDSRIIEITPLDNGVNLDIPVGVKARFSCKKPDGKKVYNDQVKIVDGKIIVTLSEQTLLAGGEAVAEVVLHTGETDADGNVLGGVLSSQNFILNIQSSALTDAEMESSDEFQSYKAALVDVEKIAKNLPVYEGLEEKTEKQQKEIDKNRIEIELLKTANEGKTYAFTTVENLAVKHDVPAAALQYARLDHIGGYTRKGKNLFRLEPNTYYGAVEADTDREYEGGVTTTHVIFRTDENGYLNMHTDGYTIGGGGLLRLKPPAFPRSENGENRNVTLSARYISGLVTPSEEGTCSIFLGDTRIALPTSENPLVIQVGIPPSSISDIQPAFCCLSGDYKIALQIEEGTTATEYEPYFERLKSSEAAAVRSYTADGELLDTYSIPEAVQALDGYGMGINVTNTNGIDFETKTFKKRVKELVLTGGQTMSTWTFNNVNGVTFPNVLDVTLNRADGVCTDAEVSTSANISKNELWIGLDNKIVYWCGVLDALNMTEGDFREYLRSRYNSGNPIRILYPSSTCEQTDVSAHIPDTVYLKVEGGGYIVAENDDVIEAPLTITYQVKL